jgi:hypothetical protein
MQGAYSWAGWWWGVKAEKVVSSFDIPSIFSRVRRPLLISLIIGAILPLSPVLAQRNLTPSKTSESDSQGDKLLGLLTYDQAIERYGIPQGERKLASGRIVSQWEKRQGISGQGQSGYGSGGGWQHISGGETLVMVCTFNEKGVLEKQTFNFAPTFGGEESKRRRCERYFKLQ